jgi:deoxyadenosine/deoxycytidine kinase
MTLSYVAVTGPVGSGKTTLARNLAVALDAELVSERYSDNPFLDVSASLASACAFEISTQFILMHMHQLKLTSNPVIVSDFYIDHDRLFAENELTTEDMQIYMAVLGLARRKIATPQIVIHLHLPWAICWERIIARSRSHELDIGEEFFYSIYQAFEAERHYNRLQPSFIFLDSNIFDVRDSDVVNELAREISQRLM